MAGALGEVELLHEAPGLFEGPLWDPATSTLLYSNATDGGVWRVDPSNRANSLIVPNRKGIGGLTAHASGGLVMSGREVIWRRGEERAVLIPNDPSWGLNRFNDICTDDAGRVYAGTLDFDPARPNGPNNPGKVFVADLDGSFRQLDDGIRVPNGMATSPNGKLLYLADTAAHTVWVYDVDSRGDLHRRRPYVEFEEGEPDGLAVAVDGSLWVAVREHGSVSVFSSDGAGSRLVSRFVPHAHPTSLCFGGADLRDLYLTTADDSHGLGAIVGQVYRMRSPVAGLPCAPARVPIEGERV